MSTESNISKRIKSLPKNALVELEQFLNYLDYKHSKSNDWADEISNEARLSIQRGKEDIENGKVLPHAEAREMMTEYLRKKTT